MIKRKSLQTTKCFDLALKVRAHKKVTQELEAKRCPERVTETVQLNVSVINISKYDEEQDHQALLKAKYSPRVAAALCTPKNTQNRCDLDL